MDEVWTNRVSRIWQHLPALVRQVVITLVFIASCLCSEQVSFYHWYLPAGVQLLAVLLTPRQYWPALIVGGSLLGIRNILDCGEQFSWMWKGLILIPRVIFLMPVVAWGRSQKWMPIPGGKRFSLSVSSLITMIFTISVAISLWGTIISLFEPASVGNKYGQQLEYWILGEYLGMLTIVPPGLLVIRWLTGTPLFQWSRRVFIECVFNLLFIAGLYVVIRLNHQMELDFLFRLGLLLPIAWATVNYGWGGAALAGMVSSIVLASLAPQAYDPSTMQAEVVIGFAISVFLALGSRISTLNGISLHARVENARMHEENLRERDENAHIKAKNLLAQVESIRTKEERIHFLATGQQLQQQIEARFYHISQSLDESLRDFKGDAIRSQKVFDQIIGDLRTPTEVSSLEGLHGFLDQLRQTFQSYGIDLDIQTSEASIGFVTSQVMARLILEASAYLACRFDRFDHICLKYQPDESAIQLHLVASYRLPEHGTSLDMARFGSLLRRMRCVSSTGLKLDALEHLVCLHHGHIEHCYDGQVEALKFSLYYQG